MDLLHQIDHLPTDKLITCEQRIRQKRQIDELNAKKAVKTQNRFEMLSKQIKHQFTPAATFRRVKLRPRKTTKKPPTIASPNF